MKTAIWVVVYLTMCFLLFTGWMFAFAQYAPYTVIFLPLCALQAVV